MNSEEIANPDDTDAESAVETVARTDLIARREDVQVNALR